MKNQQKSVLLVSLVTTSNNFVENLKRTGKAPKTIEIYSRSLIVFHKFCQANRIKDIEDISLDVLLDFVKQHSAIRVTAVKQFLIQLFDKGVLKINYALLLSQAPRKDYKKVPAVYTPDEISLIESSVCRITGNGKRNYAMLLLATRLGLRASDIAKLKLDELKWEESKIVITQEKTNQSLELPLIADVGNAIIDYLKNGRPKLLRPSNRVFLRSQAPYDKEVNSTIISNVIRSIISKSGVDTSKRRVGPHAMRHSLATNMLENGTLLPTISSILGHSTTESTRTYLGMSLTHIMQSALPVTTIDKKFYNEQILQKYGTSI